MNDLKDGRWFVLFELRLFTRSIIYTSDKSYEATGQEVTVPLDEYL